MRNRLAVLVVLGTRPEAIKLFPLIKRLQGDRRFVVRVCHSGQHSTLADPILQLTGVTVDHACAAMAPGQSLDQLTVAAMMAIGEVCDRERPDWVIVQGDTTTAFVGALAAHYRKIPLLHVEAGLRSGDNHHPWPEEANRRMISALASRHCAPTQSAAEALIREGVAPATVSVTGNTGIDALRWMAAELERQPHLAQRMPALEQRFAGKRIIALTLHRRENIGAGIASVAAAVKQLAQRAEVAFICPCHPNPLVHDVLRDHLAGWPNVALVEPLGYPDFIRLLAAAHIVLTDSGGVQEEAPSFGTPVLVLRNTTERAEGVAAGTARLIGTDPQRIVQEVSLLLDDQDAHAAMARAGNPYGDGRASERIVTWLADNALVAGRRPHEIEGVTLTPGG